MEWMEYMIYLCNLTLHFHKANYIQQYVVLYIFVNRPVEKGLNIDSRKFVPFFYPVH